MIRLGIVKIEEVLPFISEKVKSNFRIEKEFYGTLIYMDSIRYLIFAKKGIKCVCCGEERHLL